MNEQIIEIEADSLEEAERQVDTNDFIVLEKSILCSGRVETIEEIADTVEEALIKAKSRIPAEAKIEKEEIKIAPKRIELQAKGDNEESAEKEISLKKAELIESVSLHRKGRKGFLGFFKTPNVYEVIVFQQAIVEIRFRMKARLQAIVRGYSAGDLLQSVQELRGKNARWAEILELLNPKNDAEIRSLLIQLRDSYLSDLLSVFSFIEATCRQNEKANWQTAIREIHWRALDELNKRKVKLRKLDVEIAEAFMFYTSIDWYEKDYARRRKEPTGLPRTGYGKEHIPSPTLRRTLPHYSTDKKAFGELEERIEGWNLYNHYLECLTEEGQDETTATLEQKCVASLKARKEQQRGER